jgi:uncharacterized protein
MPWSVISTNEFDFFGICVPPYIKAVFPLLRWDHVRASTLDRLPQAQSAGAATSESRPDASGNFLNLNRQEIIMALTTKSGGQSKRGFASMDEEKQREIASKGGKAAHEKGTAHEFDSEEARAAGRKGGEASRGGRSGGSGSQSSSRGASSAQHAKAGSQSHKKS